MSTLSQLLTQTEGLREAIEEDGDRPQSLKQEGEAVLQAQSSIWAGWTRSKAGPEDGWTKVPALGTWGLDSCLLAATELLHALPFRYLGSQSFLKTGVIKESKYKPGPVCAHMICAF